MWYEAFAASLLLAPCISISVSVVCNARTSTSRVKQGRPARRIPRPRDGVAATNLHSAPRCVQCSWAGFTLIELMIALTIVAFLVTTGLPSFTNFLRNTEIRSTTESIVNGLRVARSEAANRNQPVRFTLAGGGDPSWSINQVSDNSVVQTYSKQEGAVNTTVAIQPAGAVAITFNGMGRVTPAAVGGSPNLRQLDISSALAASARPLRIYVDDGHGVRVCDPSPGLAALVPHDARAC